MKTLWMSIVLLLVGTAYSNQETNSFLEFNSENGYVSVTDSNEINFGVNNFSISFWINADYINEYETIMSKVSPRVIGTSYDKKQHKDSVFIFASARGYSITGFRNNSLGFMIQNNFMLFQASSVETDSLIPNEWNHVCFTVNRDGYLMSYLNGKLCNYSECSSTLDTISNSYDLYLGKRYNFVTDDSKYKKSYQGFNGYLDDIRFFKRNLSRSVVMNLYNEGYGTKYTGSTYEGGEASAVFELDEGHGNKIYDSENGLVGRLHNKVKWIND